jgi:hypothetical protein
MVKLIGMLLIPSNFPHLTPKKSFSQGISFCGSQFSLPQAMRLTNELLLNGYC